MSIENGVISIAHVDGVEGTYTNPIVTIDGYGRVSAIENGAAPSALNAEVLATDADVESYAGAADTLLVLDAGNGRSALYMRGSDDLFKGPAFITGERGVAGSSGLDGASGAKGDKGDQGERGPEGPQGQRGPSGEAGARGSDGLNGGEGPQGPQGPVGPMGSFLTPNEYGNLDEDSIARIVATQSGKDYFFLVNPDGDLRANQLVPSGISGDMSLHLVGKSALGAWIDYGQLTGAQGVQGVQGPQGIQGERGPAGEQGPRGLQGVAGIQGERGIAGQNGANGSQGIQGPQGLTGAQGPQGERGLQGLQGPQGLKGDRGEQGLEGTRGSSGFLGGVMYTVATSGARVSSSGTFQPVNVNRLVYNVGGYNFRPSGTAENALVVPNGVNLIRIGFGISFTGSITVDSSYHFAVNRNGSSVYPGAPSICGKWPYTIPRISGKSTILSVVPGDVFTLVYATNGTGEKVPAEHTFFSMEVVG